MIEKPTRLGGADDTTKNKEENDLLSLLDLKYGGFTTTKLDCIEPEKWKNIGVSVIHACKLLKDQ